MHQNITSDNRKLFKETRKGKRKATRSRSIAKYYGKMNKTRRGNIHFDDEEI